MADRVVENYTSEIPPMPEVLQRLLVEALDEGKKHLSEKGAIVPFTMLVVGNSLFIESAEGANPSECYAAARHTVQGARGASAYAFCYDGYLDTSEGTKDAIIAEGGMPGEEKGVALGLLYTLPRADGVGEGGNGVAAVGDGAGEGGSGDTGNGPSENGVPEFNANPSYIGPAPNFMEFLVADSAPAADGAAASDADGAADSVDADASDEAAGSVDAGEGADADVDADGAADADAGGASA